MEESEEEPMREEALIYRNGPARDRVQARDRFGFGSVSDPIPIPVQSLAPPRHAGVIKEK